MSSIFAKIDLPVLPPNFKPCLVSNPAIPPSANSSTNLAVKGSKAGSSGLKPLASSTFSKTLFVNIAISSGVPPLGIISAILGPKYFCTRTNGSPIAPPPPSIINFISCADITSVNVVDG